MTNEQSEVIESLRAEGYAVIIWTPEELGTAEAGLVQDRSIETGYEIIASAQD